MVKEIALTRGLVVIVDEVDYKYLSKHKWHALKCKNGFYAVRSIVTGKRTIKVYMHREIMNPGNMHVDHVDRNRLNCTRSNLRLCNKSENACNVMKYKGYCSYKGVSIHQGRYRAQINKNGKRFSLGVYDTEIEAAKAYNMAAFAKHGEFKLINTL